MKRTLTLIFTWSLFVAGYCQESNTVIADETLKDMINRTNDILEKLYAEGNIDSAATYFADDLIQMPPNAKVIKGKEAFIEEWNQSVAIGLWKFDLEALDVRRSGEMAVELGRYTLTFEPNEKAPMPGFTDTGHYLVLWEKQGDEWKIIWDAPVSELPPGGME
ncbi:YybH family protein [Robertkochia flava]|uniref:YybH family protein n=1 Tax=Robertkochia flava TaxID=3447986 RepID=UPI001CCFA330|nr:nuclear transport factor 2 family protein [Robertkochia marina]